MATVQLTVDSQKGITEVFSKVNTIHEALENASLMARTATAIRFLHQTAKEPVEGSVNPLPIGDTKVFVCACGRRLLSSGDAIRHVERTHTNAAFRRDLDRLEDFIEALVTPSPLTEFSEEVLPVRSFAAELIEEISRVFADLYLDDHDNLLGCKEKERAAEVVRTQGWDRVKGITYHDYKGQIILAEDSCRDDINKSTREDILTAYAYLLRQAGRVLKD